MVAGALATTRTIMPLGCTHCQAENGDPAIDIAFQPIFDLRVQVAGGYEALVRGPNGESAATVLAAVGDAEKHRIEQRIRVLAIEKAAALGLIATGAALSINILPSAVTEAERCLGQTIAAVRRVGLETRRVVFEFSEQAKLDVAHARALVATYKAHGFRTALDDFGDGYAGLVALAEVPTDIVKLDIGLIHGIDRSPERQAIVGGLVGMLGALGRTVVAEGIETAGELAMVRKLGIDRVQGFFLGRPSLSELQREPYDVSVVA